MKKLISLAAPVIIGTAFFFPTLLSAQSTIEIEDFNGNDVTNDTNYYWVAVGASHQIDFNQYNVGTTDITYKVNKAENLVAGATAWFCIYHNADPNDPQSQCYIPATLNSGNFITDTGSFNMLLADFAAGTNFGISVVRYKFYDLNNPTDTGNITLIYNVTPVGIAESFVPAGSLNDVYPNPSNGTTNISYSSNSTAKSEIVITDLTGKEIYREQTNSQTGTTSVNTSSWAQGLYTISLVNDGVVVARKKLVVE